MSLADELTNWTNARNREHYAWMLDPRRRPETNTRLLYLDNHAQRYFGSLLSDGLTTSSSTTYMGLLNYPRAEDISKNLVSFTENYESATMPDISQRPLLLTAHLHNPSLDSLRVICALIQAACTSLSDSTTNKVKASTERNDNSATATKMLNNIFRSSGAVRDGSLTSNLPRIDIEIVGSPKVPPELLLALRHIVLAINDSATDDQSEDKMFLSKGRLVNVVLENEIGSIEPGVVLTPHPAKSFGREVRIRCYHLPINMVPSQIYPGLWLSGHGQAFIQSSHEGDGASLAGVVDTINNLKHDCAVRRFTWEFVGMGTMSNSLLSAVVDDHENAMLTSCSGYKEPTTDLQDHRIRIGKVLVQGAYNGHYRNLSNVTQRPGPSSSSDAPPDEESAVIGFISMDRSEDLVSPLSSSFCLGGMMDQFFKVNSITGKTQLPYDLAPQSFKASNLDGTRTPLLPFIVEGSLPPTHISDDILNRHLSDVGPVIRRKLQEVEEVYTAREDLKGIKDLKQYIPEFLTKHQVHTAMTDLIHLAMVVNNLSFKNPYYTDRVRTENAMQRIELSKMMSLREVAAKSITAKQANVSYLRKEFSILRGQESSNSGRTSDKKTFPRVKFEKLELSHVNNSDVASLKLTEKICEQLVNDFLISRASPPHHCGEDGSGMAFDQTLKCSIGHPASDALALLCLSSQILGGVPISLMDSVVDTLVSLYGIVTHKWVGALVHSGLLCPLSKRPLNWYFRRSSLNLLHGHCSSPSGSHLEQHGYGYVYSGMDPIISKLLDLLIPTDASDRLSLSRVHQHLHLFKGPGSELSQSHSSESAGEFTLDVNTEAPEIRRLWIVCIIGGISVSEYYSLKNLAASKGLDLIIMSSHTINPRALVEEVIHNDGSIPNMLPSDT
eukprot:GHVH01005060.1.p1 GENE.GHVH01005060.1~~GHVH01005060.1.p1  ORF type:complete len:896 (+),score=104.17 GHVH01005060.1:50-2737(+)